MMQMKVGQCRVGMVMTNCYGLLNTQTKEMILVDPGDSPEVIGRMVEELEGKPVAIFLTHGHYDHILALEAVKEKYQIPVYASKEEEELLGDVSLNLTGQVRRPMTVRPETLVSDLEKFIVAGFSVQAIHTPGHTKGSVCYYFPEESLLVSGDTLFHGSVGRTDLPTGSTAQMMESLKRLLETLPEETDVLPGHEAATTIGYEKRYNPFV
ncbi:MAG: MBL fold metallo-hydrolase [Lachnospiraceae bacterium]|jgi:hydroxyacylglutathione hydrolase|nr:MBL fold metallo-hydrolase [Lachnospiraceae bacterium]MCI9471264.1 MBL fold metallo-hydrolase [Lachnospiraceae bacterium]